MTEQKVRSLVSKYKRKTLLVLFLFGILIIAADWGLVYLSGYTATGMNTMNFLLTVILVFIAFNGLCELIEKALVEIYNKQRASDN
ncbi:hypothetical protein SG34_002660 [Thalassomonas viridans]|uniref:Uncharacterized protein n=1 Tax=Thalassomonas viridans TaxID=137584 RepID=A0AAE9Z4D5_9GAMM|nr:hypothetical protein [Thalassomonas viridans]WDE05855.1 hypothetical protein SG34_002660 [Thalassomonas viridans]